LEGSISKSIIQSTYQKLIINIRKGELVTTLQSINPYIKIEVQSKKGKSKVRLTKQKTGQDNPAWDEQFRFINPQFPIRCTIMNSSSLKTDPENEKRFRDSVLGFFIIAVEDAIEGCTQSIWYPVQGSIDCKGRIQADISYCTVPRS